MLHLKYETVKRCVEELVSDETFVGCLGVHSGIFVVPNLEEIPEEVGLMNCDFPLLHITPHDGIKLIIVPNHHGMKIVDYRPCDITITVK